MKTQHIYHQFNPNLFEGFYESNLFNSDTELNLTSSLNDDCQQSVSYEIADFHGFCKAVSTVATSLLEPDSDEILSDFEFLELDSPCYYNYRTDRLIISCMVDLPKLRAYAFKTHLESFKTYLKDNFTSYDGFISFVPNSPNEFKSWSKLPENRQNAIDCLIEFYLLNTIDLDHYHYELWEKANELTYEYAKPTA